MKAWRLDTRSILPFSNQENASSSHLLSCLTTVHHCLFLRTFHNWIREEIFEIWSQKMKETICFLLMLSSMGEWSHSCWMSETANCHLLFLKILFGYCKRESSSLFFVGFIGVVEEIYTSDLWPVTFAISERTMFAFFSLLTVNVFLALWFVNFFLTYFKSSTSYGLFSLLLLVLSPFGLVWTRCLSSLNFRFRLLLWYKEPDYRMFS